MTAGPPLGQVAARLRAATLAAWADGPVRFREDANAEEDHGAGWYRDRVVVELAQNAADAALHAARPGDHGVAAGSLLLRLSTRERTLTAANTGAPVDAEGLVSLASLRASAKRDAAATGRFGVGFAAVRSVSDEIGIVTRTDVPGPPEAVHFSVARTAAELAGVPGLVAEAERRSGVLPALRLPFEGPGPADPALLAQGWDTAVVLRLRDADAVATVRAQLDALDDALLLALPGLASVRVEVDEGARVLADVAERWVVVTTAGEHDPARLAGRPVEERGRTAWRLTWAVPRRAGVAVPPTVHAPTPTDDPCGVPALLLGTFPLDPGRRRVTPGPVTDALVAAAGRAWPDLLLAVRRARASGAHAPDPLDLVPLGFPAGPLDAALRSAVLGATAGAPVIATPSGWVAPREALVLAPPWDATDAPRVLGRWFGTLADASPARRDVLRALGVTTVGLGELVEQLPAAEPAALRDVYALLALGDADELGAAPVPLADGRVVRGARGTVLLDDALLASDGGGLEPDVLAALVEWGLRVVHPEAAHPALERLGAQRVGAAELARHAVLRDRVLDGDEHAARVLLALVAAVGDESAEPGPSWWSEALLPDEDGEPTSARGLVLPGSPAAAWFDPDELPPVDAGLAARHPGALARIGVRAGLVVERVDDLVADAIEDWAQYVEDTGVADDGACWAVADLDAVRDWPAFLAALARHPEATTPVRTPDGDLAPAYAVWRLRDEPTLGTGRPFALPDADRSAGVLAHLDPTDPALVALPAELLRALGGVARAEDLDDEDWAVLLDELEEGDEVPLGLAVDCWRALAARAEDPRGLGELAEVALLPGWDGSRALACAAEDLVTADPAWRRLAAHLGRPVLPVPFGVDLDLGLDDAADVLPGRVTTRGRPEPVPAAARDLVAGVPATVVRHDRLEVDGRPLDWWVQDGVVHATEAGLAEGLAAVAGWAHRHRLAAVLADPGARDAALLDLVDDPA